MTKDTRKQGAARASLIVSPQAAATLAACVVRRLADSPREVARLLLLCRGLTYTAEAGGRETLLTAIEREAAPFLADFDGMMREACRRELATLAEKGGDS